MKRISMVGLSIIFLMIVSINNITSISAYNAQQPQIPQQTDQVAEQREILPNEAMIQQKSTTENEIISNEEIETSATNTPIVRRVIIQESVSGDPINYAEPGMVVDVSVLATGPFDNDDIKIEIKRDIVFGTDTILGSSTFSGVTLADNTTQAWFNATGFVIDNDRSLFGETSGQIRSYYVQFIEVQTFADDIWFRGGPEEDGGTGTGFLYTYGTVTLDQIQYYNITDTEALPIERSEGDWVLTSQIHLTVGNAPIWDFSIFINFKYDVVFGIDDAVSTDQAVSTFSLDTFGVLEPGEYTFIPSDINGDAAFIYLDGARSYGDGLGDSKSVYGILQVGDTAVNYLNDVPYSQERSYSAIPIFSNIIDLPPQVTITSPLDGDIIDSDIIQIEAKIRDANSNYQIDTIMLNGTNVLNDYYPLNGSLITEFVLPEGFDNQIFSLEILATDSNGNSGSDSIVLQSYDAAGFFPVDYAYQEFEVGEKLIDIILAQYASFTYTSGDDLAISITPIFSVGFSASSGMDVFVASPNNIEAGELASFYAAISNPKITFSLNFSLDVVFEFTYNDRYFGGIMNVYFQEYIKEVVLPLGVTSFTLDNIIGPEKTDAITNFQLKLSSLIPAIGWLGDVVLSLEIQHLFKQITELNADISINNGASVLSELTWQDTNPKVVPVTADISEASQLDFSLSNFEYSYRFGLEIYFQLQLSGRILTTNLGPYDLNRWMAENLGIIVPYIDTWLLELNYQLPGTVSTSSTITDRNIGLTITAIDRTDNAQILTLFVDSRGVGVEEATIAAQFKDVEYTATEIGSGYYELDIDRHSGNESLSVTATKTGYGTASINGYIDVDDSTTETVTGSGSTITEIGTSTSTVEETQSVYTTIVETQETIITNAKSEAGVTGLILISLLSLLAIPVIRRKR